MIVGLSLIFASFVLLRFLDTCPQSTWHRMGSRSRNVFSFFQSVLYWGALIAGLVLTFLSSVQIGLVAFGTFLFLYNVSVSNMKMKAIPLIGNLLAQSIGLVVLIVGVVLSFVTSWQSGALALAGYVAALVVMNILMAIEMSFIKKWISKRDEKFEEQHPTMG